MYDSINGMIQRTALWVASVKPDVENYVFNGHRLDVERLAGIYGTLKEAASSYNAVRCEFG